MAGVKRKLDHDPAPNAPDPDLHPSQASSPAASATPERDSNAVTKAVRGARVRPKAAAVTATTATTAAAAAATTTSTPSSAASSQPQSPAKKRRRTRDEILAEQFDELPGPRTTRQSARILSQRRATDPAPNVAFGAGSLPKAASMEPGVPGVASFDTSHESLSFDLGAGLLLGPTSAAPTAATTSAPTDLENSLQAVDNNDASGESSSAKPKRRRRLSDRKRARSAARDDLDSPGPGVETPTTSPIKTPKREHSDDSDAQDDTPSAAASRSVPALTLATDLPASQSTDVETPDGGGGGGGAGRPASALSMSPPATQSEAAELSASTIPAAGGRTRAAGGRPRGKGKARKPPLNRKAAAAAGKAAAPRMHAYDRNLSPSASAAVKKLRDRQRELQGAFRRVSSAQRAALLVLANRSESRLAKDPKAHMSTPLYQEVLDGLEARLEKQKALINREYDLKVQCEKQYLEAAQYWINSGFEEKVESVRDEHILAAQGSFLQYLDQCRQAGDDDHTETEESDTENWRTNRKVSHQSVRGFDGSYIRRPSGASLYDRADSGWDDFIQRARIGGDIFALLKDMDQEARRDKEEKKRLRQEAKKKNREAAAEESEVSDSDIVPEPVHSRQRFKRLISALADACQLAEAGGSDEKEEEEEEEEIKATEEPNPPAYALNALADIALQSPTSIQSSVTSAPFAPPMEPVATTAAAAAVAPPPEPAPQPPPVYLPAPTQHQYAGLPAPRGHPRPLLPQPTHGQILPAPPSPQKLYQHHQYAPPELPPPLAPPPMRASYPSMPRPLLPASRPPPPDLPPIRQKLSEALRLPDPFSSAPPHLPAPAGLRYSTGGPPPPPPPPPPPHHAHPHVRRASQPAPYAAAPLPPPYLPGPPPPSSAQQPPPGYAHPVELPLPGTLYQPQSIYPPPYYSPYHHPHPAAAPPRPHQSVFGRDALQLGHPPRGALHPQMHPPPPPPRY
ncbi:hypothetical protein LOZ57_001000 [Ophidiomyces ophidiicola]|uniref:uncharacterized protein n=1 Tax=Ophidiomyces ophidiicola TaxID=1387563 RepID=UPI0020C29B1F|nr:uncharacterized protein LOZ57_001000 [Ophidiomyces ophidiicola]KAI1952916.1 hypothetical protein LOZ57_001000 [Ophidiomyces ophidiicola]